MFKGYFYIIQVFSKDFFLLLPNRVRYEKRCNVVQDHVILITVPHQIIIHITILLVHTHTHTHTHTHILLHMSCSCAQTKITHFGNSRKDD